MINIDRSLILISGRQMRKYMKDNKLVFVYDFFDSQLTSCEEVLGVLIDDNLPWTIISNMFQKRYRHIFDICFR